MDSIITAVVAVVFLCLGYHFGRSEKLGKDALKPVKEITKTKPPEIEDAGFYDR